jgi:hypothetical protein
VIESPSLVSAPVQPLHRRSSSIPFRAWSRVSPPVLLAVVQALVSVGLVGVELAEPPAQPGLRVLPFSNVVHSKGARSALRLYRDRFGWLPLVGPGHVLSPGPYLFLLRAALVLLFLIQIVALWAVLRERRPSLRRWMLGPVISSVVLLAYPPINTDVFFYASVARVANGGGNPYLESPHSFGRTPFDRYSDWQRITAPYGPIWTWVSRLVDGATGTAPFATSLGFKVVASLSILALGLVTARVARRLTGDARLAVVAFVLVAWSPVVLYETAGTAHFDALLMALALAGLLLLTSPGRGRVRLGLLAIAASALCKPVTLPLLGAAALVRLANRADPLRVVVRRWLGDAVAIAGLFAVAFAAYWGGGRLPRALIADYRTLYVFRPLHASPFWFWLMPQLGFTAAWIRSGGTKIAQTSASLLAIGAVAVLAVRTYRLRGPDKPTPSANDLLRAQVSTWAVVMVAEGYLPTNAHAWYMIWGLPLVSLIAVDRGVVTRLLGPAADDVPSGTGATSRWLTWSVLAYFGWTAVNFFVYHTLARG